MCMCACVSVFKCAHVYVDVFAVVCFDENDCGTNERCVRRQCVCKLGYVQFGAACVGKIPHPALSAPRLEVVIAVRALYIAN